MNACRDALEIMNMTGKHQGFLNYCVDSSGDPIFPNQHGILDDRLGFSVFRGTHLGGSVLKNLPSHQSRDHAHGFKSCGMNSQNIGGLGLIEDAQFEKHPSYEAIGGKLVDVFSNDEEDVHLTSSRSFVPTTK